MLSTLNGSHVETRLFAATTLQLGALWMFSLKFKIIPRYTVGLAFMELNLLCCHSSILWNVFRFVGLSLSYLQTGGSVLEEAKK
jgi:hypothetical protein